MSEESPSPVEERIGMSEESPSPVEERIGMSEESPSPVEERIGMSEESPSPVEERIGMSEESPSPLWGEGWGEGESTSFEDSMMKVEFLSKGKSVGHVLSCHVPTEMDAGMEYHSVPLILPSPL